MEDELNPEYMMNTTATKLLVQAVNGEIDLLELARKQLASRGLDEHGEWVGFREAKRIHGV